ncbi:MAG: hypothetical protein JSW03_05715 [Candidatus Eiseniibacteriota bacterium]|nr:MAG: hypothetical protein JSW03_05715 [Candidatus Eisenbacteria bacterium]
MQLPGLHVRPDKQQAGVAAPIIAGVFCSCVEWKRMVYWHLLDTQAYRKRMGVSLANVLQKPPLAVRAEEVIRKLRDVSAVSVLVADGQINEIHVTTASNRTPKQLVRDVESILEAEMGIRVDHRCVSVAQKKEAANEGGLPELSVADFCAPDSNEQRVRFGSINVSFSELKAQARVELWLDGHESAGFAEGSCDQYDVNRLIAIATLQSIRQFIAEECSLALGDVEVIRLGPDEVVVANVKFLWGRTDRTLVGSTLVSQNLHQSVVYAVLDAVNRVFGNLRLKEPVEYELRPTSI